ncbi:DUF389 domain-containing protein [Nocardia vaccinii]|uniref:DUF389 domain-containing protein n=1 Tax=Nocardia vaccinii TaxID=1822 RepID=UPI00082A89EB|nr:DUF389 domain-containing protein [Nocardia vaccinii]
MLHVRVICPSGKTESALAALRAEPGATLITVQRGAAVEPPGDVLEADVARESVDDVVEALEALGIGREGGIVLGPIDTARSDSADRAVAEAPGDPSVAVVWEALLAETRSESALSPAFLAFITIACLLAAVGIATDSPVTIVGAMVVGPEFGPLAALAVSLVRKDFALARRSALALIAGFSVAMVITWAATLVWEQFGWLTLDSVDRIHNVEFIYQVGPFSLVVALLAGAAGMLSLVTSKSAALVGVFISVTTIPAAGFAVVAATVGAWDKAFSSIGQLGVNMIGIVVAGWLVLQLRPRHGSERGPLDRFRRYWASGE